MTAHGVLVVARQELRTRLRTGRWRWLMAAWFIVVGGFSVLFRAALGASDTESAGVPMFGGLLLFVLALTLLVAPALTAQSINGDRERGTLATLQITRLSAAEIALGKLLAAWGVGLSVLALTLPFIAWPVVEGDIRLGRGIVVTLVVALLIGVVCAISMGLSALVVRSITSALLSYLTVFALMLGTVLLYFLTLPFTEESRPDTYTVQHSERVWWLLAPNPFVVLADAAPRLPAPRQPSRPDEYEPEPFDPLGGIGRNVRDARQGPGHQEFVAYNDYEDVRVDEAGPVWPYGLAFNLVLAGGAVWITIRRLRTPAKTLPRGTRIA